MGSTGNARVIWLYGVVYWYAEFPFADVYRRYAECGEYSGKSVSCLWLGNEGGGSGARHSHCSVCRTPYGRLDVACRIQTVVEIFLWGRIVWMELHEAFP